MHTVADLLTDLVRLAAEAAGYTDSPVPLERCVPTDPRHGDYQSNYAFRLGKALRTNPRAVAQAVVDHLPAGELLASADVAGPGFINLRVSDPWLAAQLVERAALPDLGAPDAGAGRTMVIDYSSPNIAKRMHVGHLRSTVIGSALDRIHRYLGWTVIADNHVGDWGTQFGKLMVAWRRWKDDALFGADAIGELQRLYQLFGERAKEDATLVEEARAETARLQAGDAENTALWKEFVAISMAEFDAIYARLGIRFDETLGESAYQDRLQPLIQRLLDAGIAVVDQGAVIVPFEASDGKGLAKSPLLIRKSDGAALYGTTDIATVEYRLERWGADAMVYVTDNRQQLHFRQFFAACRKLGISAELTHVYFGILRVGDAVLQTREAGQGLQGAVDATDLWGVLDAAAAHARLTVDAKSGHLSEDERAAIAEAVGLGAIKYADLSQNPQSDITFDWEKMMALEGNTAPYLMYAHARCHSIFRKAGLDLASHAPGAVVLDHPSERALALAIAQLPEAALRAASAWRPNLLADHIYGLANAFSAFYRDCRVIGEADDTVRSRLALVFATARALETGLGLLGIRAVERM